VPQNNSLCGEPQHLQPIAIPAHSGGSARACEFGDDYCAWAAASPFRLRSVEQEYLRAHVVGGEGRVEERRVPGDDGQETGYEIRAGDREVAVRLTIRLAC